MSTAAANRKRKLAEAGITDPQLYLDTMGVQFNVPITTMPHLTQNELELIQTCRDCLANLRGEQKRLHLTVKECKDVLEQASISDPHLYLKQLNIPPKKFSKTLTFLTDEQRYLVDVCRLVIKREHTKDNGAKKRRLAMLKLNTEEADKVLNWYRHMDDGEVALDESLQSIIQNNNVSVELLVHKAEIQKERQQINLDLTLNPSEVSDIDLLQSILDKYHISSGNFITRMDLPSDVQKYLQDVQARLRHLRGKQEFQQKKASDVIYHQHVCEQERLRASQKPSKKEYSSAYRRVRSSAISNNIAMKLSKHEISYITRLPCYYCNKPPRSGVDRMNSNGIYIMGNVLPACSECNLSKGGHLPDVFVGLAHAIIKHMGDSSYKYYGIPCNRKKPLTFNAWKIKCQHEVLITEDEYWKIVTADCHYCGMSHCGGADRVDTTGVYVSPNIVPACWICNRLKLDMTYNNFLAMLQRIVDTHQDIDLTLPIMCDHSLATPVFTTGLCGACYYNQHVNSQRDLNYRQPYEPKAYTCLKCGIIRPKRCYADEDFELCVDCKKILINV